MRPCLLINVVGLTPRIVAASMDALREHTRKGALAAMDTVLPAVTCSAQATMLTGLPPSQHGVVGNGWFDRSSAEVRFWQQSNALVAGPKLYERARERDTSFTCAKIFWWWNMGARVEYSITPRPFYPADGRKIVAVYSNPSDYGDGLEARLGRFPFFDFWGPKSGLPSSRWLADAAIDTLERVRPSLTMVYLPHLDYSHQRWGPEDERSRQADLEIDAVVDDLFKAAHARGVEVVLVSEYGLEAVDTPVHPNRALRRAGLLSVRETPVGEMLDPFASRAFCVSDHQLAHVYCKDLEATREAQGVLAALDGVESVLGEEGKRDCGLDHARAGDLVCVARKGAWFTYYYWLDDARAPDFAPTVDIHRKPGYDPCDLFLDPKLSLPKLRIARRLAQKLIGMRYLMDVIPLDATLVGGSHGRLPDDPDVGPVFACSRPFQECGGEPADGRVSMRSVPERVLALMQLT